MTTTKNVAMAVFREYWQPNNHAAKFANPFQTCENHQAIYLLEGSIVVNDTLHTSGDGFHVPTDARCTLSTDNALTLLRFVLFQSSSLPEIIQHYSERAPLQNFVLVLAHIFNAPDPYTVLRLDQVDFPPGAVAYKHTHPGGGIRYLTQGSLKVCSENTEHKYSIGDAWFEEANTPVEAHADKQHHSRFVRMLLLPKRYYDKSTFTLANANDASKPTKQTNKRFFDLPL